MSKMIQIRNVPDAVHRKIKVVESDRRSGLTADRPARPYRPRDAGMGAARQLHGARRRLRRARRGARCHGRDLRRSVQHGAGPLGRDRAERGGFRRPLTYAWAAEVRNVRSRRRPANCFLWLHDDQIPAFEPDAPAATLAIAGATLGTSDPGARLTTDAWANPSPQPGVESPNATRPLKLHAALLATQSAAVSSPRSRRGR
jgi:hypothetical protein